MRLADMSLLGQPRKSDIFGDPPLEIALTLLVILD